MSVESDESGARAHSASERTELPTGWAEATIGDLAEVRLGRQRSPKQLDGDDMRPYLRAANVAWDGLRIDDVKTMNFTDTEAEVYRLVAGDILLNEASGSASEVGKPALWSGEIEDCCFQNTLLRVRLDAGDPRFWMHLLRYEAMSGKFGKATRGVGMHHLGAAKLVAWPVHVPPVAEQSRIASTLDERFTQLDEIEGQLRSAQAHFNALWQRVLDGVAMGLLGEVKTQPPAEHLVQDVAEVRGGIQKQSRRQPDKNAFPFLRVANVGRGTLDLDDVHEIELFDNEIDRYRLEEGDLLVVEGNGSPDQIGRAATWDGSIEDCVHQNHLIRVRPGPKLRPAYLSLVWNSPTVAQRLQRAASSSSGLLTLSTRKLKELVIPVAESSDQDSLVEAAHRAQGRILAGRRRVDNALAHASALRRAIFAEAFAGRLVPQDPDDEPSEDLLKRIRTEREAAEAERKATRRAATQAKRKSRTKTSAMPEAAVAPPPAPSTDASLSEGEQTILPLEFTA